MPDPSHHSRYANSKEYQRLLLQKSKVMFGSKNPPERGNKKRKIQTLESRKWSRSSSFGFLGADEVCLGDLVGRPVESKSANVKCTRPR